MDNMSTGFMDTAMINIPEHYRADRTISLRTILSGIKKPADKKKLKSCLKCVCLTHQIQGETIPSFVDDRYRYEVIQFLDVQLDTIKKAESAATVLQKLFKPPCIIQFNDSVQGAASFADKRLSRQDDQEIVLEEQVVTPVWYNSATLRALFGKMETLRRLTLSKEKAAQTKDKVELNQQMKAVMQELETILMQFLNEQ